MQIHVVDMLHLNRADFDSASSLQDTRCMQSKTLRRLAAEVWLLDQIENLHIAAVPAAAWCTLFDKPADCIAELSCAMYHSFVLRR